MKCPKNCIEVHIARRRFFIPPFRGKSYPVPTLMAEACGYRPGNIDFKEAVKRIEEAYAQNKIALEDCVTWEN